MLLRLATRSFLYRPEAGIQSILENERCEGACYFSKRQRLIQTENFLCAACWSESAMRTVAGSAASSKKKDTSCAQ